MIIKQITLENFRSFYGENVIQLKNGLNLFIGDNGDGKTTLFEALEWLFNTSENQKKDRTLLSAKRLKELSENETDFLRVSIVFDHDEEKIVEKSFSFTKLNDDQIQIGNLQFKGWYNELSERIPVHGGPLLDRVFEASIRRYTMFKGEQNLNVFNNSNALKHLIETFSNIKQFDPYYTDDFDSKGFSNYAEELSYKAYQNVQQLDKRNSVKEKQLRFKIDEIKNNIITNRQRLKTQRENFETYSVKLQEIEKSKDAGAALKEINERIEALSEKKISLLSRIDENYSIKLLDDMWILNGFQPVLKEFQDKVNLYSKEKREIENKSNRERGEQDALKTISKNLKGGFVPLSVFIPNAQTMSEMIEDEICKVCGRKAEKGTEAYKFMTDKLQQLLEYNEQKTINNEPVFPNNYTKELEHLSISLGFHESEINKQKNKISELLKYNEARKAEINETERNIDLEQETKKKLLSQNDSFTEDQLKNAYETLSNLFNNKHEADKQIARLERESKELHEELADNEDSYNKLAIETGATTYSKINIAFNKIKIAFKNAKEKNTNDFLRELEAESNKYLEKLNLDGFHGIIRILKSADNNANIELQDVHGTYITDPNEALKTTMYMSVLFAISELTSLKRDNDYPLIFDAPTSSFTEKKQTVFFNVISEINKQCLIFTKSFLNKDGVIDEKNIESLNCSVYRIQKERPFDERDLTTIRTVISPVKL